MEQKIIDLLSKGLSAVQVAKALGVTEGYVSQLANEDSNKHKIQANRAIEVAGRLTIDSNYDKIEEYGTEALLKLVETKGSLLEPMKLMKIVQTANTARRRLEQNPAAAAGGQQFTINVTLPNVSLPLLSLVKSANNEVLEVGGQQLLTMPSQLVKQAAQQRLIVAQALIPVSIDSI